MRGWVGQTQWRLETRDRHAWTVLNLSVSGARVDVADLWATTGPPWRGQFADDWFHPNDEGYRRWADAMVAAVRPR